MTLPSGSRFGPFEIVSAIGAGGMGEVYQARDTKLHRTVALKTLPPAFASDPDRVARFRREAQVLASLNHPNIAAIYGFEDSGSTPALVMEFVPGRTLTDLMASPMAPADALGIARQIATALEAAHEQNIIHRDLKPANVKITGDGTVKVLDFGLAKALGSGSAAGDDATAESTMTSPAMTGIGVILGTARYMAPEQAKGRPVDRRADIWALGVILFEMLAGRALYRGETVTETIAHVITQPPAWDALPATTASSVRRLLRRCLEKEPKNRLHSAADVRIEIDECLGAADQDQAPVMAGPVAAPPRWQRVLPWALAAALLAALVAVLWPRAGTTARQVRFDVLLGGEAIRVDEETKDGVVAVISPDGQTLAYLGLRGNERRLYLRPLKGLEAAAVPGSERAYQPFFSADGREIAFFSDGTLKRAAVAGGAPTTVVPADDARGGAWGPDNTIVFAPTLMSVLMRVPASGGTPVELTKLGPNERTHRWPSILPDGKHVLFMCQLADGAYDDGTIEAARLDTGERKVLVRGGTAPLYVPGYLLYTRRKSLYAVRFDPERLETSGDARLVLAGVMSSGEGIGGGLGNGSSQVSIASSGTAVFIAGASASTVQDLQLSVLDRDGNPLYTHPGRRLFRDPRFSPDAKLVAVRVGDGQTEQIHVLDPSRGSLPKLTTVGTASVVPVWSRNGKLMAYSSDRAQPGGLEVFLMKSDGSGEPKHFASNGNASIATSFSQDDSMLLVSVVNPKTNMDLLTLSIADGKTAVFLQTPASEGAGQFSPDGKWVVYQSQEISGAPTSTSVFVCAYPGCTSRRQVSGDAGLLPFWTKNGTEIVYATPTPGGVTISAVGFRVVGGEVELGKPVPLFEKPMFSAPISTWYHASEDGTKFVVLLMNSSIVEPERRHVTVILNFLDEIRHVMERAK